MSRTGARAHHRPWLTLAAALVLLVAAGVWLVRQHLGYDLASARVSAERELRLLASIVGAHLHQGSYQDIEALIGEWGGRDPEVAELRLVADNGFVLGQYARAAGAVETLSLEAPILYSYRGRAVLTLRKDLAAVYAQRDRLAIQLGAGFVLLGALLGVVLQDATRRRREAVVLRERSAELRRVNAALGAEVDQRRRAEKELFEAKERAEVTLHSIGDGVLTTDARGIIEYLNPVAERLTQWTVTEARGRPLSEILPLLNELTREPADNPVDRALREGGVVGLANHSLLVARDGSELAIEDSAAPIRDHEGRIIGVVLVFHDVSASRALTQQLNWQATHDALTGLINRREFEHRLGQALAGARVDGARHALIYLDLDQFKIVNDTCGHVAGDELLRQLSTHMHAYLRASDTLARLGGDEFGVLLEHCPLERAERIAATLCEATREFRFLWENRVFEIGVSIGLVPIDGSSASHTGLLAAADMACYAAKEAGGKRVHVYHESDAGLLQRHGEMLWVARLNEALQQDRFVLYRQDIAPARGAPDQAHFEVLVRLRGPDGELVPPAAFLPAAERYNLMPAIDRWVVRRILAQEAVQPCCGDGDDGLIAVNLSGASLGEECFLEFLRAELAGHAGFARRLCFEITETAAIANLARASAFMHELRGLGCRFALDDFGAGLSSFGYLKHLPVDFLKIDGNLVKGVVDSRTDLAMVRSIHEIGHTLGICTIAEFVENDAIRALVAGIGVDYVQGYGVALPRPFGDEAERR